MSLKGQKNRKKSPSRIVNAAATVALAMGIVYVCTSPAIEVIERANSLSEAVEKNTLQQEAVDIKATLLPAVVKEGTSTAVSVPSEEKPEITESDIEAFTQAMYTPLNGVVTSGIGEREDPFDHDKTEYHKGIDIMVTDDYGVRAAEEGVVELVASDSSYGNYIIIEHPGGIRTLYAHCEYIYLKKGDNVYRGMLIAKAGMTGKATGVHLHFEILG